MSTFFTTRTCILSRLVQGDFGQGAPFLPGCSRTHTNRGRAFSAIRYGREEDVHAVAMIEELAQQNDGWTYGSILEELQRERSIFLVMNDSPEANIVGWAVGWLVPPDEFHVLEIAVHPGEQGKGHGKALLLQLLLEARRMGSATMALLEVRASNEKALALYQGTGFNVVGRRKGYYKDGEDAILMTKLLEAVL